MSRMQEDIQYAGSDTRPPMLDRTDFESWQQRIRLYCLGKDNGENIMKSIKEGPFQMGTVSDVITGGTEGAVQQGPVRARVLNDLSAEEKERYKADIRATNILLQGIPKDIYSLINHYTDAKDIWENVKMILEGSELTKDDRESQLYDEYEHFRQIKGEGIQGYYVRFTKLINDMRNIKMTMSRMQLNSKFVNNMLPEWSRFITEVMAKLLQRVELRTEEACVNPGQRETQSSATTVNGLGHHRRECPRQSDFKIQTTSSTSCYNASPVRVEQYWMKNSRCFLQRARDTGMGVGSKVAENVMLSNSDVDEWSSHKTMFMANPQSEDPIYDERWAILTRPNPLRSREISEITRKRIADENEKPSMCVKIKFGLVHPPELDAEGRTFGKTVSPKRRNLTPEQIFWSRDGQNNRIKVACRLACCWYGEKNHVVESWKRNLSNVHEVEAKTDFKYWIEKDNGIATLERCLVASVKDRSLMSIRTEVDWHCAYGIKNDGVLRVERGKGGQKIQQDKELDDAIKI
ncbi:hypothetical protein Tco_0313483 [Tanacetum coccineum]